MIDNTNNLKGIAQECYPCVINQAKSAARFAGLDDEQTGRVIAVAEAGYKESKERPLLVQHIVRRVADAIIRERGMDADFDIYADIKRISNELALTYADLLQEKIYSSDKPLETGLQIAAAGNIIDFGAKSHGELDIEKELQDLQKAAFARYDIEALRDRLASADKLLYLCDNSGEVVFDRLFIKEIKKEYPNLGIVMAFRDKPIINDATLDDSKELDMERLGNCISSGSIYPGTILPETSAEFRKLFDTANVIISKGQGNFETLLPYSSERLFFVLRIKCEYMAKLSGVEKDNLVLMQGE